MAISKITTGSISDSVAIDTDTLVVDGTNNRVGIGTSSPVSTIDVNGLISLGGSTSRSINYRSVDNDILYEFDAGDFYRQNIGSSQHEFFTGNVNRMTIDSSGRVTMPYQPAFRATMAANSFSTGASSTQINYDTVAFDRTNSYSTSTGRYTVPIAGLYVFTHNISSRNTVDRVYEVKIFKNGTEMIRQFAFGKNFGHGEQATTTLMCAANDYIEARGYWGTSSMTVGGDGDVGTTGGHLSYFSGYLLG